MKKCSFFLSLKLILKGESEELLQVIFSSVEDNLIPHNIRIDFSEVVSMTHDLEMKCREEKRVISSDFKVIASETDTILYRGVFNFGSYDYPNIYHQVKNMTQHIKVNKKNLADKTYLLEQIEELTPDEYKVEETIDKTLINLDKSKISKLKKWQRIVIYSFATLTTVGLVVLGSSFILQKAQYEEALSDGRKSVKANEELVEVYETALLGSKEELEVYFDGKELNENQQHILVDMYLKENKYDKAVAILGDPVEVETIILNDDFWANGEAKINKLKEFNELYPTNEARFDLAYFEKEYELMLNLPTINMTAKRSRMKTYALMKLGKIDEAKVELNNNNDEKLIEKIDRYEILQAEIKTLTEKIDRENQAKEKNTEAIDELTAELKVKKEEFSAL